jgi:hypothetical protein
VVGDEEEAAEKVTGNEEDEVAGTYTMQTWKISSSSWCVWLREVDGDVEEEAVAPFHGSGRRWS